MTTVQSTAGGHPNGSREDAKRSLHLRENSHVNGHSGSRVSKDKESAHTVPMPSTPQAKSRSHAGNHGQHLHWQDETPQSLHVNTDTSAIASSPFSSPSSGGVVPFPTLDGQARRISASFGRPRQFSSAHMSPNRPRGKSLSEQSKEAVKVLAPPVSVTLVTLCLLWYTSSAVSNNLAKSILNRFPYPVSLTMIQFVYAVGFSTLALVAAHNNPQLTSRFPRGTLSASGVVGPSRTILLATGPMAGFQLVGHILSYSAMSQVPVSLVHAIKSLSPLFTVAASVGVLGMRYNLSTYASMIPLTSGVVMTCSAEFRAKPLPLVYALGATAVFVAQNLFSKKLLTPGEGGNARRFDKITILGWCAAFAFVGTLPIWLVSDAISFLTTGVRIEGSSISLLLLFTLNGLSHFCQNLLSFLVLGSITPVSFSIASLIKRVVVICVAILWFGQHVSGAQGWGIVISFFGLYVYDRFGQQLDIGSKHHLPR